MSREYYFNDAGDQIRLLGESVQARARGEEVPEGGYQGEYVAELAAEIPGAADGDPDRCRRQGCGAAARADQGDARALRGAVRRASSASGRCTKGRRASSSGRWRCSRRPATCTGPTGRDVAADDHVRRRQGPGRGPLQRRAHLPRRGHRLPAEQARARVRAPAAAGRLRPSRLRARAQGGDGRARAAIRTRWTSRCCSSCTSCPAARRSRSPSAAATSSRSMTCSTRSASTPRATSCCSARTTARSISTSTSRVAVAREPRVLRPVRPRPDRVDAAPLPEARVEAAVRSIGARGDGDIHPPSAT